MTRQPGPWSAPIIVMGISGTGKTTIAAALGSALGGTWADADDLHSAAAVTAMSVGTPLTDTDREPWLDRVARQLADPDGPRIMACSALKRRYRDQLRSQVPEVVFIQLYGSPEVIAARHVRRDDHFMPTTLLDSQWADLEDLASDEAGFRLCVDDDLEVVLADAVAAIGHHFHHRPTPGIDV